jgi:hypothetical protein
MSIPSQQLRVFSAHALDWIGQNLPLFDPLIAKVDNQPASIYHTKAMGELGLLCLLCYRYREGASDMHIERFLDFIQRIWMQPAYKERIARNPAYFQIYAMTYVVLRQCRRIDDTDQAYIQRILEQGYVMATETTAMRLLDRRHMLDAGNFYHRLPSYEDLYERTLLAQTPSAIYLTDMDVYAITHTLFYFTDFGRYATDTWDHLHLHAVQWTIKTLLGVYTRHQHWDLVAELLLCCHCLHWQPAVVFTLVWERLMAAQLSDGALPGPRYSATCSAELAEKEKQDYCFEQNYHTTIVGAMAGFLISQWLKHDEAGAKER